MNAVEKIKQESATLPCIIKQNCPKLWRNVCSICLAECEFEGEKTYAGRFVNVKDVLKILKDEKQKFQELGNLVENYPKLHANSSFRRNSITNALVTDYENHFKKIMKKFVEVFGVESVKPTKKEN